MREIKIVSDELGPHLGWRRQDFLVGAKRWQLFTIDRDDQKQSAILEVDALSNPSKGLIYLDIVLTVQAAYDIIRKIHHAQSEAFEEGRRSLQRELKILLNVS